MDELDLDSIIYEEHAPSKSVPPVCEREEIGIIIASLARIATEALSSGIRIIIDVEPVQYESALSLLSTITACLPVWKSALPIKNTETGEYYTLNFSMFTLTAPRNDEVAIVFMGEKRRDDEILRDLEFVLANSRLIYFMVVSKRPSISLTSAIYRSNIIFNIVKDLMKALDNGKEEFVGKVPYEVLLFMSLEHVKKVAETFVPPPPANAAYLNKKPRTLDELVIPDDFKETLRQFITVLRIRGKGSLALVGLPRSGRKTIAATIARTLGLTGYWLSVSNVLGKYVGESEERFRSFFDTLRSRGGLVVIEGVESLYRKSGHEETSSNLRSILFQEMARDDNNFVAVFTFSEEAPGECLDSPLLGEVKFVVPLPTREDRRKLTRLFLWEIAERFPGLESVVSKYGRDVFEKMYAEPFVIPTAGLSSGEIYQVMEIVLIPVFAEMATSTDKLVDITRSVLKYTKRDLGARRAKIKMLNQLAISLGHFGVANTLRQVYEEVMSIDKREEAEKYRIV